MSFKTFKEYKSSPTLEVMKVKLEKVDHDVLKDLGEYKELTLENIFGY